MSINSGSTVKTSMLVAILASTQICYAQDDTNPVAGTGTSDFTLFENVESTINSASAAETARNARGPGSRNTQAAPTFTLVGTTRIGNRHTALLKHMNGETVKVPLLYEINPVPGHDSYTVLQYGAGQIALRYPAAIPCGDFPDLGVSCNSTTNIATLGLTTAAALVVAEREILEEQAAEEDDSEAEEAQDAPRNPFAVLRDRNQQGRTQSTEASRFQPRRIPPEEVPPGYRVVSTPFGDRLVEQ